MVPHHSLKAILILLAATLACSETRLASTPPLPAPIFTVAPTSTILPPMAPLTVDAIRNALYQINTRDDHPVVQLTEGQFIQAVDPAAPDYASIFVTDFIVFGDMDGDGVNEAAVIVAENFGGTGQFTVLAVYRNENGLPVFVTSVFIDDRAIINLLNINDSEIFLDATIHSFDDPGCCPALRTTQRYMLLDSQLRPTHFTTSTPAGATREIEITSPPNGSEVHGSIRLVGTVTIAPFENNLVVRIFDLAGTELLAGPLQVIAPAPGSPATFDSAVDLSRIPLGTVVFIEVQDTSAADGSLLAMDSVQLVVK